MKKVNIITKRAKRNLKQEIDRFGFANIQGELEIIGYENGKPFHYDKNHNVVTIWSKHATMHLLTGEIFSAHGQQRSFLAGDHQGQGDGLGPFGFGEGVNADGTLLSGQQFFSNNIDPNFSLNTRWSKSTIAPANIPDGTTNPDEVKYPYFPTKMLFGTGFEFATWAEIQGLTDPAYEDIYTTQGWSAIFDNNVSDSLNDYSNRLNSVELAKTRTMNDVYSGTLENEPTDTAFAVAGAVKNGNYTDSDTQRYDSGSGTERTMLEEGNEFIVPEWRGIGKPSFIYARRELRKFEGGSEVALSADEGAANLIENKITMTVVMPEQTGDYAGVYYPYNGFTLKQAGLFCDAHFLLQNSVPETPGTNEYENYIKQGYGIMVAVRNIAPIQKSHNVSISARWTLYF